MVKGEYKTTELGLIPSDWEVLPLRGSFDFFQNNTYARDCLNPSKGAVQNIHYGDVLIKYGSILDCETEEIPFINPDIQVNLVKRQVQSGDIIIADTAEDNTVGKATEVINLGKKSIVAGLHTIFIRPHAGLFAERFLGYFINSSVYHDQLLPYIVGTKVSSVSKGSLQETFILRPPHPEQRAIAAALSDVDGYIATLERLIGKKRDIKKGAMQELLTGKRRLPGFCGKWEVATWKDVLDGFSSGATPYRGRADYYKGDVKWVSSGELNYNIIFDTLEHISETACIDASLTKHPVGTFLMAITGLEAAGTRGSCAILGIEATTNQSCMAIYSTNKMSTQYLFHYYILFGESLASQYCQGTKQQSYTAKIVKELPVFYPSDVNEQMAIIAILSDMDAEIDALTAKLDKVRNIKQGMMQELLTGRIRLVAEETEVTPAAKPVVKVSKLPKREPQPTPAHSSGHSLQFDDAVMIAGIVDALYSDKYPLGRKKVQKCLYLLRRHQDESTAAFKKKAAGPYADEVRYKGGEPIARNSKYIVTTSTEGKGTTFACGGNISQALGYIQDWGRQADIKWLTEKLKYKKVDELELLATVDMAICDLMEAGTPVSVATIKHLIATNAEWKAKLKKQSFSDANIEWAIKELQVLL